MGCRSDPPIRPLDAGGQSRVGDRRAKFVEPRQRFAAGAWKPAKAHRESARSRSIPGRREAARVKRPFRPAWSEETKWIRSAAVGRQAAARARAAEAAALRPAIGKG